MIDWIRKRIIIEKNAERQPKKSSGGVRAGEEVRAGMRERERERAREREREKEGEERQGGRREREGERTIGNNISIPIEPTHTNATVRRGCLLGGKGRRGSLDR